MFSTESKFAVLGLGQVGLPLALALAERYPTIGVDADEERLQHIRASTVAQRLRELRSDVASLGKCDCIFITLPSGRDGALDFAASPLASGCQALGRLIRPGTTLVFESTVHPGATEELCIPIIEATSGLKWKEDFFVAYSPERINPGDRKHTLATIPKLVAADCADTLERVAAIYQSIISAGVHRMTSIRAAELTKVLENVQRDVNIALMNELSQMAHGLQLDPAEIIGAAATKWNFARFRPGLVGGACLSLASQLWEHTRRTLELPAGVVTHGRQLNESVVDFVAHQVAQLLTEQGIALSSARVVQYGAAFKANVALTDESRNLELAKKLGELGTKIWVHDPHAVLPSSLSHSVVAAPSREDLPAVCDMVVFAVAHDAFKNEPLEALLAPLREGGTVMDLTHALDGSEVHRLGFKLWRL